jgi:hypothetical protein
MDAGTNSTSETLIQAPGLPPTDPTAWTANQLRTQLLSGDFDVAVLTGHFSAGSLLAADYVSEMTATEVLLSSTNLTDMLILTLGCHGGYTIPSGDLIPGVSPNPDWAKAFLRKGAAGYVAATGYAYGDTELTEYGERLFLRLAQQLRTGTGPISIGQALVKTKQKYLSETAQLTGIDHKTIVEMALYGLPMMRVDMPGARLTPPSENSIVSSTTPVSGASFGLRSSPVVLNPVVNTQTKVLPNLSGGGNVTTTYLTGADGVVVNPFEPIYPKEIHNVSVSGNQLRGVAINGGTYTDLAGIVPLTSSPTTETSTAHLSYNTSVFYPTQTWSANYFDALAGGNTRLIVFPAQFQSSAPTAIDGTLRKFNQLDLELYYLPDNWSEAGSPADKAAAVSAAPVILGASGVENGTAIDFSVNALAEGSAGVHEVWILYTGRPGSAYHETWTRLNLAQQNMDDPTLWTGTLNLQAGEDAGNILFMVQTVGGAGLTTLGTNLGAYYSITDENAPQLPPPAGTTLELQSPPASGTYLKQSSFDLYLQSGGQPLAGKLVTLDIGGQQASGLTDSAGEVTLTLNLVVQPGAYTAEASFRGDSAYLGSNDTSAFTVNKDTTTLTVTPIDPVTIFTNQPTPFVAVVRDSEGRPLGGKSVIFIVHNGTDSFATSVIADFQGNAALGPVSLLPPGTYEVDAYFNGTIPLTPSLTLEDDYYLPSSDTDSSLTILGDDNPPTITATATKEDGTLYTADTWTNQTVTVHFTCTDTGSGIASCPVDQVYSTDGIFTATGTATDNLGNSASTSFGPIKIDKTAPTLAPSVSPNPVFLNGTAIASANATDAGSGIATQSCGAVVTNAVGTKTVTCSATDNAGNTTTANAQYRVIFNFTGFFSPVDNPPVMNQMNAGRSVSIKFHLDGNQGLAIFAASYPMSQQIQCTSLALIDVVEQTSTAGSSSLSYDPATNTYNYVWKTETSWAGTCRQFTVQFIDGQSYTLLFKFK